MNPYVAATLRFWWVSIVGVLAAAGVAFLMIYHVPHNVTKEFPPKLVPRDKPTYVATNNLLVDAPTSPFLRAGQPVSISPSKKAASASTTASATGTAGSDVTDVTKSLIQAANLFPLYIQSDAITERVSQLVGPRVHGAVTAKALFSFASANRFRPGSLPVIQIIATSRKPRNAIRLADGTATAFRAWILRQQRRQHIPLAQRIVLRQLEAPHTTTKKGGPSYGLPVLGGLAVLAAFLGVAILLERSWPRKQEERQTERPEEAVPDREEISKTSDTSAATIR